MSTTKEKNSVWIPILLLPIGSAIFVTMGSIWALIGVICFAAWFVIFRGSQKAFNAGNGMMWWQYLPFVSKQSAGTGPIAGNSPAQTGKAGHLKTQQNPVTPSQAHAAAVPFQAKPNVVIPPQAQPVAQPASTKSIWRQSAPAFNKQRLTATIESLKWSAADVDTLAREAGENLQYGLAFRSQYGNIMPHSQRLETIQMSEIAAGIKGRLPQDAVCRAWPLYELSKGINMDGLLVVPDKNKPLGLYLILAGDSTKSRFTVFSMFVPVCTGKAEWIRKTFQPSAADLKAESELAGIILRASEQIAG